MKKKIHTKVLLLSNHDPRSLGLTLVKLTNVWLMEIIGISNWEVGSIPHATFSKIDKDNDFTTTIQILKRLPTLNNCKMHGSQNIWHMKHPRLMVIEKWLNTMNKKWLMASMFAKISSSNFRFSSFYKNWLLSTWNKLHGTTKEAIMVEVVLIT